MMSNNKTRNHIGNEGVGENRNELYQLAFSQFNKAMDEGFYLEAVSIIESVIADRMESRIGQLTGKDVEFGTLSKNRDVLNGSKKHEKIEFAQELIDLYNKIVSVWAGKRNEALHRIVKISTQEAKDYDEFLEKAKETAVEGRAIFNELKKLMNRKSNQK